ncbi:helix-turn-helix domain-containing protein [Actinopolymorpha alba]|uniref:helix-turn-helix domain-containing protein n=1 Tax=Actinopolymorpha alba TaxID=533267 RepID=UPI000369EB3E|nr:XRE family transcriptional regulator [Actinopolymorpha alba]
MARREAQMLAEVHAYELAEMRRKQGLTQEEVAAAMRVTQSRVSRIERGDLDRSEVATLRAYVEALGGTLEIVADFGGQRVIVS